MTLEQLAERRQAIADAFPDFKYLAIGLHMPIRSYSSEVETEAPHWQVYARNLGEPHEADIHTNGATLDEAIANAKKEIASRADDLAGEIKKKEAELAELVKRATERAAKKVAEDDLAKTPGRVDAEEGERE